MSTRSTTHFRWNGETEAIVYRHSDGYPEVAGRDLHRFLDDVEAQTADTRFNDPSYLAAKYVVWLAAEMAPYSQPHDYENDYEEEQKKRIQLAKGQPLNFLSVGICKEDPGDIEFYYVVDCSEIGSDSRPAIRGYEATGRPVDIPS